MDKLLAHIREHGEVKTSDFDAQRQGGNGWWGWKDEKRWLEALFALGELMIARRENFQRVYDLSDRVLARIGVNAARAIRSTNSSSARYVRSALLKRDGLRTIFECRRSTKTRICKRSSIRGN